VELLQDWPKVLSKFRTMQRGSKGSSTTAIDLEMRTGTADQQLFLIGLQSLRRAHRHHVSKNFDKVMFNLEVLSFTIWWFRVVRQFIHFTSVALTSILCPGVFGFST
jgi:hypothetical protein